MENLSQARQTIMSYVKHCGGVTVSEVAEHLSISYEAARQQLSALEKDGLITSSIRRRKGAGRPASEFRLTDQGEDLFPKAYDELAVEMIDSITHNLGREAMQTVLGAFTEARVARWMPLLQGMTLEERLEALKDLYVAEDPYTSVEREDGELLLIERNCPFLNIAEKRPALCSVTVSTLQRLLGYRIERVEKFQAGHGRCVFRVRTDKPLDDAPAFEFEANPTG